MTKPSTTVLASAALLAMMMGGAVAGPTRAVATGQGVGQPGAASALWHDQHDNDAGKAVGSQNYEPAFDDYDNGVADDFTVPEGQVWKVGTVNVTGRYSSGDGPARSMHVTFYKDKGGKPGAVVADYPEVTGGDNGSGSFNLKLPAPAKLKPGSYWVSVQANMDMFGGGQWAWQQRSVVNGTPAKWRNPGNGSMSGCVRWRGLDTCLDVGKTDMMFSLGE